MKEAKYFDVSKYDVKVEPFDGYEWDREARIPFLFDEAHDYHADIDFVMPPFQVPVTEVHPNKPGAAFDDSPEPRMVRVGRGRGDVRTMPSVRYVRAVDPQGNIGPLSISTRRPFPDPKDKGARDGHDGCGTPGRVLD